MSISFRTNQKRKQIKISRYDIIFLILGFSIFEPTCLTDAAIGFYSTLHYLFSLSQYVSLIALFLLYFKKKTKPSLMLILFIIFDCVLMVSTLRSGSSINETLNILKLRLPVYEFILLFDCADKWNKTKYFIRSLSAYLFMLILLNFACICFFPDGMYRSPTNYYFTKNYIFGYKNVELPFFSIGIAFCGLYKLYNYKSKIFILSVIIVLLSAIQLNSATTLISVALVVFFICFTVIKKNKITSFLKPNYIFFYSLGASVLLIGGQITSILTPILGAVNRDYSFTGRTEIWQQALLYIAQSPYLGNGNNVQLLSSRIGWGQCHNFYLDLLYRGGLIYFLIFVIIILYAFKKLDKTNGSLIYSVILSCMILFFVFFQQEGNHGKNIFFILIYLAYRSPEIMYNYNKIRGGSLKHSINSPPERRVKQTDHHKDGHAS